MFIKRSSELSSTPSTFTFSQRQERLNWRALSSPTVLEALKNGDIETLQSVIQNFTFAELTRQDLEYFKSSSMIQLFKLTQLACEYMIHCQDRMLGQNQSLQQSYNALVNYEAGMQDQVKNNERDILRLKEILAQKKRGMKELENAIRQPETAKGITKAVVGMNARKCTYCPKYFISEKYLNAHLERRHGNLVKVTNTREKGESMNKMIYSIQRMMAEQIQSINQIHQRDIQLLTGSFQKQIDELYSRSTEILKPDYIPTQEMNELLTQASREKAHLESLLTSKSTKLQEIEQANLALSLEKQNLQNKLQCLTSSDFLTFNAPRKFSSHLVLSHTESLTIQPHPGTPRRSITSLPSPTIERPHAPNLSSLVFVDYSEDVEEFPSESELKSVCKPIVTPREPRSKSSICLESKENPLLFSDMSGYEGENEDTHSELLLTKRFSPSMMKHVREMLKKHEEENTIISLPDEQEDKKLSEDFKTPVLTQFSTPLIALTPVDLRADLSSYHSDILKSVLNSENEGLKSPIPACGSLDLANEPLYLTTESAIQESSNISQEAYSNKICLTPPMHFYNPDTPLETQEDPQIAFTPAESFHEILKSSSSQHYISSSSSNNAQSPNNCKLFSIPSISFTPAQPIEEAKLTYSPQSKSKETSLNVSKSSHIDNFDHFLVPAASTYQSSTQLFDQNDDISFPEPEESQKLGCSTPEIPLSPSEPAYESSIETDKDKSCHESFYKIEEEVYPNRFKQVREEIATEINEPIAVEISEICITQEDKLKIAADMIGMNWNEDWRYRYLAQDFIEATQDYDVVDEDNPVLEQYRNYFHDLKLYHENLYVRSMNILSEQPRYLILTNKYQDAIPTYFEHSSRSFKLTKKSLTNQLKSNSIELHPMKSSAYRRYERHVNSALDQIIQSLLNSLNLKLPISKKIQRILETISEQRESFSSLDLEENKQNLSSSIPYQASSQDLVIDISPPSPSISDKKLSPQEYYSPVSSFSE